MTNITTGLTNGGRTAHYQFSYDSSLSQAGGPTRVNAVIAACEADFVLMQGWFGGINLTFSYPLPVQIQNASGGASWSDPAPVEKDLGAGTTVVIKPGSGTPASFVRYLLVSEVVEIFMLSQNKGWFYTEGPFHGGDEGSKGEGLSRFLGVQFLIANGLGAVPPAGFGVTTLWLNGSRQDFVDNNPDDHNPDPTTGCTTLFLYYLYSQLGYGIDKIVAAASSNLAGVYQNLTGKTDAWTSFINLVNAHYPPGPTYNPLGDNIFPVSELSQLFLPGPIVSGYGAQGTIVIDRPAMAQVIVQLGSADPDVQVPATATVPVGGTSIVFTVSTSPIKPPFAAKNVTVTASYAGKQLTATITVVPPTPTEISFKSDNVVAGQDTTATVALNAASLLGPVSVDIVSADPGWATAQTPLVIPQNKASASFTVTTPKILTAFPTAHAVIYATSGGVSVSGTLTVTPSVILGIVQSLTLFPTTVTGGGTSTGTVTLEQAVPTDTLVGLAASSGGPLPVGRNSTEASVPASITIPAGHTVGAFGITTKALSPPTTTGYATISAAAVDTKYALLTVKA